MRRSRRWSLFLKITAGLLLLAAHTSPTHAQEKAVEGTVTDQATGNPLPGVNVVIKGTNTGTTTNTSGRYEITVPGPEAVLVFSFIGYQEREVSVGEQTVIDVTLRESQVALEEVVVTGYGEQQRQDITGSVSSVEVAEANVAQVRSPQDLLKGRVAGVSLQSNSGEPGAGVDVRVRGTSSISAGSDPLYVIDGVPINNTTVTPNGAALGGVTASSTTNPLSMLNPSDIESMEVLKDAAATAIYGSQGANGVVLIETKSGGGAGGGIQVDYRGSASVGVMSNELDLLSGDEYRQALEEFIGQETSGSVGTDWQDATTESAVTTEHNLSFSGGSESTTYRASLNYLTNEGVIEDTGIERTTARVNVRHAMLDEDRLQLQLNLTGSYLERDHAFFNQGGSFQAGVIKSMLAADPRIPVMQVGGEFTEVSTTIRNPVAMNRQIQDDTAEDRILGNITADFDLLSNLTLSGTVGVDRKQGQRRTAIPQANTIGEDVGGLGRQGERELTNISLQSTIDYSQSFFGNQTLDFIGGFEYDREVFQSLAAESRQFNTDALLVNDLGAGLSVTAPSSNKQIVKQVGFFGRVNYNIQDKYLIQGTFRRDGSSVFGEDERFAWFPSGSIGWRISNEPFMDDVEWLDQLKLRASFGISGNQAVPPFQSFTTLQADESQSVFFGDEEEVLGIAPQRAANPDLRWEETTEYNIGADFTAWRLSGSVNFYLKNTDDLLLDVRVPQPAQSTFVLQNVGEVENRGIEVDLSATVIDNEVWTLDLSGTASSNFNEVESLGGRGSIDHTLASGAGQTGVLVQRLEPGHPIGAFFGPIFEGIDENGNETYRTEDGGTTTELSNAKSAFLGNPIPDANYSFGINSEYKSFDLSMFFRGEVGKELFNNTAMELTSKTNLGTINVLREAVNDGTNTNHVQTFSSRWIENASFLRLDNVTIGYTLPNPDRFNFRRIRVFASGENLVTITPYEGFDPEVNTNVDASDTGFRSLSRPDRGVDYMSFPRARTFTFGLEFGL